MSDILENYKNDLIKSFQTPLLVELSKKDLDKFRNDSYIKAKEISILVAYRYFQMEQKAKVHGSNFIFVDGDICEKNNLNNGKSIFLFETILELTSPQMKKVKNVNVSS